MHLLRRLRPARLAPKYMARQSTGSAATSSEAEERIEIPNRIHRSPTDILRALSSTVGVDPTAAHYKYHDDPYLIPHSNVGKRTFAMAQEAGRKAAQWIVQEHRQLFMHQEAQPPIEAFAPRLVFDDNSEVDEMTLQRLIKMRLVSDATFVYNLMKTRNIEINPTLRQSFLELISFYNHEDPLPDEAIEERWFQENVAARERHRKTWKDGGLAEQIFQETEPKTSEAYEAIIRGMAKYYQAERAYALFQEAAENNFPLTIETYNSIISVVNLLKDNADKRWELCVELLRQMAQANVAPNLNTMNALLECVSTFSNFKFARSSCLKVLSEFKNIGIEPSLGTYYYVLVIFCRDRSPVSHILYEILQHIEGKEFKLQHPKDTFFFTTAMDVCRNHLQDKKLAKRIHAILHTGRNYELVGDSYKESIYYRHYFALLCRTEPLEEFMKFYDLYVPNIYTPEPGIMEELLKSVEMNAAIDLVPRLWSDMIIFDHTSRESLLVRMLRIMTQNKPNAELETHKELPKQFAKVAIDIYNKVQDSTNRVKRLSFTGQMIGGILTIVLRGDDFEKACEIFTNIDKNQHRIPGTPSEECLVEFVDACIANKAPSQAIACLEYAVENNMDSHSLAKRINTGFTLNETHLSKIRSLIGDTFLGQ